jgi:GNAT superfamily N-acetyltransferase
MRRRQEGNKALPMTVEIKPVASKSDLKTFVLLPHSIFKGCPQWVPPLIRDELATLDPAQNPAFEDAEAKLFVAVERGKPVGRMAGIISHAANKKYHTRNARFGWFDFVQDDRVAEALFSAVGEWARGRGMDSLTGPHGFTNFDRQGMLVEGFEYLGNAYTIYNYPYYVDFVETQGFQKDVDYIETESFAPENGLDPRYLRIQERLKRRADITLLNFKTKAEVVQRAMELFRLFNETYSDIYGVIPLSDNYIQYVIKKFIPYVNMDLVSCAVDSRGRMVGFMITMPSLAKAFQKADGKLFPFGWYHLWRGFKSRECLDLLLVAVEEEYRRKGVAILMLASMVQKALAMGFRRSETGPMLENNGLVQSLYKYFPSRTRKRRRIYKLRF